MDFATLRTHAVRVAGSNVTPHGRLLEAARGGMSKREAARRAGISEGRWRQVVTGVQSAGGTTIPVNPRRETLIAMAKAVQADVDDVLKAAGMEPVGGAGHDSGYVTHRHADDPAQGMSDPEVLELVRTARRLADELERRIRGTEHDSGTQPVDGPR